MKSKLSPRESFSLYGFLLGFIFLFYLVGLVVGKNHFTGGEPLSGDPSAPGGPLPDMKIELDFYQRVMTARDSSGVNDQGLNSDAETEIPDTGNPGASETDPLGYTIQVGAFTIERDVRQILLRLEARGYSGSLRLPSGEDRYYRVSVGQYSNREAAQEMESRLGTDGFLTYVKRIESVGPIH